MHIDVAIEEYLACKKNALTHDTYHWYKWMLGKFEQWCQTQNLMDLEQITPVLVQKFAGENLRLSDNTKYHRARVVKSFLRWCSLDEEMGVKEITVRRIEMPKVEELEMEIFSDAEVKRLLAACGKTRHFLRNRAIILLLLDTGVRVAELCYDNTRPEEKTGLLLEDIKMGAGRAGSYITVMGKGRKSRTMKIGKETRLALKEYLKYARPQTDHPYVFVGRKNAPLTVHGVETILTDLGIWCGVKNVYPHRFRHTYAINQLLAGTDAFVLMRLMGHTTLEATLTYIRALTQMQVREISASVVDVHWQNLQPVQDANVRKNLKEEWLRKEEKAKKAKETEIISQKELVSVSLPKSNKDMRKVNAQWRAFFRSWQERQPGVWLTTSEVGEMFADALPGNLLPQEGEHPKAFLYRLRTALQERLGVSHGDVPISLACWPASERGMHKWQVYQVPPAR